MKDSTHQSFGGQVLTLGFVQVVLKLRLLIVLPILTRALTQSELGVYSILTAFASLANIICVMGTNSSLQVYIPAEPSQDARRREFWSLAQIMLIETLIVAAALIALRAPVVGLYGNAGIQPLLFAISVALIPLQALNALFLSQALNNRQARDYARIITWSSMLELGVMIASVYAFGLAGVLGTLVFKQVLLLLLMGRAVSRKTAFAPLQAGAFKHLKKYYSYGLIMFVSGLALLIVEHSDKFIIGKLAGMDQLGVYSVAYGIALFAMELAVPVYSILLPFVTSSVAEGREDRARHYLERSFRALMLVYAPAVLLFTIQGRDLLGVFTTREYLGGAVIFPWVVGGIAVVQLLGVHTFTLHAYKKGAVIMWSTLVAAGLNVALNLWLIPGHGIVAAAWSTCAAYVAHFIIVRQVAVRYIPLRYGAGFLARLAVCGAGTAGAMHLAQQFPGGPAARLIAGLALGGAAYVSLLAATRCVPPDERRQFVELIKNNIRPDQARS